MAVKNFLEVFAFWQIRGGVFRKIIILHLLILKYFWHSSIFQIPPSFYLIINGLSFLWAKKEWRKGVLIILLGVINLVNLAFTFLVFLRGCLSLPVN